MTCRIRHTHDKLCLVTDDHAFMRQMEGHIVGMTEEGVERCHAKGHQPGNTQANEFNPSLRSTNDKAEQGYNSPAPASRGDNAEVH